VIYLYIIIYILLLIADAFALRAVRLAADVRPAGRRGPFDIIIVPYTYLRDRPASGKM